MRSDAILYKAYEQIWARSFHIYVFQVGRWQAYFRVDSAGKKAKGIYIRHLDDSIVWSLRSILERIR